MIPGKCNRKQTAVPFVGMVRVKGWCKRPPAVLATRQARYTPSGARPNRKVFEAGPAELSGRLLEAAGNRRPRGMTVTLQREQNPAYSPTPYENEKFYFCDVEQVM